MFAPLYLSNYCVNGCTYCPYHAKNKTIARKKLTQEEIRQEVIALSLIHIYLPFIRESGSSFFIFSNRKPELHHSTHSSHSGSAHWHFRFVFLLFYNYTFSSQEHTSERSCIFQSNTSNLSRVYYTGSMQIFVNVQTSVVTKVTLAFTYFLNNYRTFFTGICYNFAKRLSYHQHPYHDVDRKQGLWPLLQFHPVHKLKQIYAS